MKTRTCSIAACCTAFLLLLPGLAAADAGAAAEPAGARAAAPTPAVPSPVPAPDQGADPALERFVRSLDADSRAENGECSPAVAEGLEGAVQRSTCYDCDSPLNSCTPGTSYCRSYCLQLTGEIGICSFECKCCVCPEG